MRLAAFCCIFFCMGNCPSALSLCLSFVCLSVSLSVYVHLPICLPLHDNREIPMVIHPSLCYCSERMHSCAVISQYSQIDMASETGETLWLNVTDLWFWYM